MWVTKQLLVHTDFDSRIKYIYVYIYVEVTGDQQLFGFPYSSK